MIYLLYRLSPAIGAFSFFGIAVCSLILIVRHRGRSKRNINVALPADRGLPDREQLFTAIDKFIEADDLDRVIAQDSSFSQMLWSDYDSYKTRKDA